MSIQDSQFEKQPYFDLSEPVKYDENINIDQITKRNKKISKMIEQQMKYNKIDPVSLSSRQIPLIDHQNKESSPIQTRGRYRQKFNIDEQDLRQDPAFSHHYPL